MFAPKGPPENKAEVHPLSAKVFLCEACMSCLPVLSALESGARTAQFALVACFGESLHLTLSHNKGSPLAGRVLGWPRQVAAESYLAPLLFGLIK